MPNSIIKEKSLIMSKPAPTLISGLFRGCDVGTSNLVAAANTAGGIELKRIRNAFIEIDEEQKSRLAHSQISAVHIKNNSYIVGDEAIAMARILGKDLRRPMASGVLNPEEKDGRQVITALVKALLGEPRVEDEPCCFSVPAVAVDNPTKTGTVWHTGFFTTLINQLGFEAIPVNEALAIVYAECAEDDHSGIAISHGAGQVNVCASYKLVGSLEFSIARSGDWIDQNSAIAVGTSIAKVMKVKEHPDFDLLNPDALDDEIGPALAYHYTAMIKYELQHLVREWSRMKLDFPEPVPIVLSGGTASIKGFRDLWEQEFDRFAKKTPLPFKVKEVRMAKDPFGAVARGLLTYAMSR